MDYDAIREDLNHLSVVTTTPFDADAGRVRHDKIRENLRPLVDAGVRVFVPCAGAGEIKGLTLGEQIEVVETTVDAVGDAGSVFGGVAGNYQDALHLIEKYERKGADGVMIRPPGQRGKHQRGILEYYRTLVASTELGVMLYRHDPVATDEMIDELSGFENVLAVKYKDDLESFWRTRERLGVEPFDELAWLCGANAISRAIPFIRRGGTGIMPSLANFLPRASVEYQQTIRRGDWSRAEELHDVLRPYQEFKLGGGTESSIPGDIDIPAIKYGQELAGMYGGPTRKPLLSELSDGEKREAEQCYQHARDAFASIRSREEP